MKCIHAASVIAAMSLIMSLSFPDEARSGAIGQLEELTGTKIDRHIPLASPPSRVPSSPTRTQAPKTVVKKPSASSAATMNALSTTMMVLDILNAMNAADTAEAEAARAMAEAEQNRLAEAQRKQRIISAEHLRNFWDGRDREISESLDDVFSVPGQGQGTAFFGNQSNPVAMPSDMSDGTGDDTAVAIGGDGAAPRILGTGAPDVRRPYMAEPSETFSTDTSSLQDGIIKTGVEYAKDVAKDSVKDIMKDLIKGSLPTSARNAELMVDYVDGMKEFTGNLFQAIEPQRLVGTLANGGPGDFQAIMNDLDSVTKQGASLGLGEIPFSDTELSTGFKLLNGGRITGSDIKEIASSRWKGFLSDRLKDRLTDGWM